MEKQSREVMEGDSTTDQANDYTSEDVRGSLGVSNRRILRKDGNLRDSAGDLYSSSTAEATLRGSTNTDSTCSSRGSYQSLRGSVGRFNTSNKEDESVSNLRENLNMRGSLGVFNNRNNLNIHKSPNNFSRKNKDSASSITTEKYKYLGLTNSEGKREGFGVCFYQNGDKYSGSWANDKKEGFGVYSVISSGKVFRGEFKNNQIDGFVEYINKQGVIHHGIMCNQKFVNREAMIIVHPKFELAGLMEFSTVINKLTGLASIKYKNGVFYEGETLENHENGWGITKSPDGSTIRAYKDNGSFNSYCEIDYPTEEKHFGWFQRNKRHGIGVSISGDGVYSIGKYNQDIKDGGFLICCKGEAKFELYLCGFLVKTVDKKENIINYLNVVYPEYRWLCRTNNQLLVEGLLKT